MNMIKSNNGKRQGKRLIPNGDQRRYTGDAQRVRDDAILDAIWRKLDTPPS